MIAGSEPLNGLNISPMDVSERSLYEIHLPPYKKAIDAGVYTIMAAHNELNGIPSHMHKGLMTDLLRNEWGFDGYVVSDWGAATETIENALGGLDLEMPGPAKTWGENLLKYHRIQFNKMGYFWT